MNNSSSDQVSEMVERVALAVLKEIWGEPPDDLPEGDLERVIAGDNGASLNLLDVARAAIEAMREPNEAMKNAVEHTGMMWVWSACIDIALSSKGSGGGERSSAPTNPNIAGD